MRVIPTVAMACCVMLGSCTGMRVAKVGPVPSVGEPSGVRAALPIPLIMVTPDEKGAVDVRDVYLPDPDNTFAFDGWSVLATHSLEIKTAGGILTSVGFDQNAVGVIGDGVAAVGAITAASFEGDAKAQKAERERRAAQAEELRKAKLALEQAQVRLQVVSAEEPPDLVAVREARIAVRQAQAVVDSLEARDEELVATHDPSEGAGPPGPIFYRIEEELRDGRLSVELVPANVAPGPGPRPRSAMDRGSEGDPPR